MNDFRYLPTSGTWHHQDYHDHDRESELPIKTMINPPVLIQPNAGHQTVVPFQPTRGHPMDQ